MDKKFVRDRITELRMRAEISEYQLSLELGHSKSYIQAISSGRTLPSLSAFFEICNYFNISPLEFFENQDDTSDRFRRIVGKLKLLSENDLEFFEEILDKYYSNLQNK